MTPDNWWFHVNFYSSGVIQSLRYWVLLGSTYHHAMKIISDMKKLGYSTSNRSPSCSYAHHHCFQYILLMMHRLTGARTQIVCVLFLCIGLVDIILSYVESWNNPVCLELRDIVINNTSVQFSYSVLLFFLSAYLILSGMPPPSLIDATPTPSHQSHRKNGTIHQFTSNLIDPTYTALSRKDDCYLYTALQSIITVWLFTFVPTTDNRYHTVTDSPPLTYPTSHKNICPQEYVR